MTKGVRDAVLAIKLDSKFTIHHIIIIFLVMFCISGVFYSGWFIFPAMLLCYIGKILTDKPTNKTVTSTAPGNDFPMALKTLLPEHFELLHEADVRGSLIVQKEPGHRWPKRLFMAEAMASLYLLACVRKWGSSDGPEFVQFILTESGRVVLSLRPVCCVPETARTPSYEETRTGHGDPSCTQATEGF